MFTALIFYMFAGLAIASGVMVISSRNPVHSVLWLILAFFNAAGLFLLLGAEFLAMVLVIVYVGAVAVLFLFVVMMLDINMVEFREGFLQYLPTGALIGLVLLMELLAMFGGWAFAPDVEALIKAPTPTLDQASNTVALGKLIYTNFVKEAIELNPFQSTQFAWMDMRLHCVYDMQIEETNQVMSELPENQVRLMQMSFTDPVHNRRDFYRWTRGKVAAGFFAGNKEPLLRFCILCQQELVTAIEHETAPTDEMIYSFIASHYPELFDLYVGEYSDCLRNQLCIRKSLHLVYPFLETVHNRAMYSYTIALSKRIRKGVQRGELHLNPDEIHKAYTFEFFALIHTKQPSTAATVINEYMDIAGTREDVAACIRERRNHLHDHLEPEILERWMAI